MKCYNHIDGHDVMGTTRRYGSYCHYIPGCIAYNNYGQCFECIDGYYFSGIRDPSTGSVGTCRPCKAGCKTCH